MLIVSQNKAVLINFDNILGIQEEEKDVGVKFVGGDGLILGSYKTKKRAKEVLQEIVDVYKMYEDYGVYEMPKE